MNIGEKVAYLKGLAEGLEIGTEAKSGRVIHGILDVLEEMACILREAKPAKPESGEKEKADSEYLDGVFELVCPQCKKQIYIQTDEILKSDTMAVQCPKCGYEIDIIDEAGHEGESSCESCPGCAGFLAST